MAKIKVGRSAATGQLIKVGKPAGAKRVQLFAGGGSVRMTRSAMSKAQVEALAKTILRGFTFKTVRKGKNWFVVPAGKMEVKKQKPSVLRGSGIPSKDVKGELPWATDEQLEKVSDDAGLLSSDELSDRLQVSRETTHRWRKDAKIIGFEMAKRGFRYPAEQLDGRGRPIDGIQAILEELDGDHWAAWRFLREPIQELGGTTGFALLSDGKLKPLLRVLAARAHGSFS